MGKQQSKDKKEEEDEKVFNKKTIYIDEYGNFVLSLSFSSI